MKTRVTKKILEEQNATLRKQISFIEMQLNSKSNKLSEVQYNFESVKEQILNLKQSFDNINWDNYKKVNADSIADRIVKEFLSKDKELKTIEEIQFRFKNQYIIDLTK